MKKIFVKFFILCLILLMTVPISIAQIQTTNKNLLDKK